MTCYVSSGTLNSAQSVIMPLYTTANSNIATDVTDRQVDKIAVTTAAVSYEIRKTVTINSYKHKKEFTVIVISFLSLSHHLLGSFYR